MTLDDIQKFFSALARASYVNADSKAAHLKTVCQNYLTFLKAYLSIASELYVLEQKEELIKQLQALASEESFAEFASTIAAIICDVQADGIILQTLLAANNEDAQQFISGLETEFSVSNLLDARNTPIIDDKENIFAAFHRIEQDFNNSRWRKVLSPYQTLRTRLLTHNPESFSDDEKADIEKFHDIYVKSLMQLASAEQSFSSAVDAFYMAMHEARKPNEDLNKPNPVLDECILRALTRLGTLIQTVSLSMTNFEHFETIIKTTKQRMQHGNFSMLSEPFYTLQYKFAILLNSHPTSSDESALENNFLALRMLNNLNNQNVNKPLQLIIYEIHKQLCLRFTNFARVNINNTAAYSNVLKYFNRLNQCHQELFDPTNAWALMQRFYLNTFTICITLLAKKLSCTAMLAYLQTALLEHKKIPPQFRIPSDFEFERQCRERVMVVADQVKRQSNGQRMYLSESDRGECLFYKHNDFLDSSKVELLIFSYQEMMIRTAANPNLHNTQRLQVIRSQMSMAYSTNYSVFLTVVGNFRALRPSLSFYTQANANSNQYHQIENAINTFIPAATITTLHQFKTFMDTFKQEHANSPYTSFLNLMDLPIVNMHRLYVIMQSPTQQLRITA